MYEKLKPEVCAACVYICANERNETVGSIKVSVLQGSETEDLSLNETNLLIIYTVVYFLSIAASDILFPVPPVVWRSI